MEGDTVKTLVVVGHEEELRVGVVRVEVVHPRVERQVRGPGRLFSPVAAFESTPSLCQREERNISDQAHRFHIYCMLFITETTEMPGQCCARRTYLRQLRKQHAHGL